MFWNYKPVPCWCSSWTCNPGLAACQTSLLPTESYPRLASCFLSCVQMFKFILFYLFIGVCFCICVWFVVSQRAEEHITYPGAGVIDSCDPPDMDAHNQIQILWNSSMFSYPLQYGFNFICVYAE